MRERKDHEVSSCVQVHVTASALTAVLSRVPWQELEIQMCLDIYSLLLSSGSASSFSALNTATTIQRAIIKPRISQ